MLEVTLKKLECSCGAGRGGAGLVCTAWKRWRSNVPHVQDERVSKNLEKDESLVVGAGRGVDGRGVALGLDEEVMYFMF